MIPREQAYHALEALECANGKVVTYNSENFGTEPNSIPGIQ